jgi:hypothetical protein
MKKIQSKDIGDAVKHYKIPGAIIVVLVAIMVIGFTHLKNELKNVNQTVVIQEVPVKRLDANVEYDSSIIVTTAYSKNIIGSLNSGLSELDQELITEHVTRFSLSSKIPKSTLYTLIYTESRGDPRAFSSAQAVGLTQVTQPALDEYNKAHDSNYQLSDLYDVVVNLNVGFWFFDKMQKDLEIEKYEYVYMVYFGGTGNWQKHKNLIMSGTMPSANFENARLNWNRSHSLVAETVVASNKYFRIEL